MASRADSGRGAQEVTKDDVLYDDRQEHHYVAVRVNDDGVTMRRQDTEYYVPHTIFTEWYDPTQVTRNEDIPVEAPDWLATST
ncbi:hypothetical protein BRC68_12925 [Halobacteriales archaeon QH_6_64_20]|nr:MAG: hypothetical protein BRC68_12925 [Halobacteriales archaeon QH_6_64_20]